MSQDDPLFEVTSSTLTAAARRLTTAAYVSATMSSPPGDTVLENYIDEVSAKAAIFCNLATVISGTPASFASETCRATWFITGRYRGDTLFLPWRTPITSITSVIEDGVMLTADIDYRLQPGAALLRLDGADGLYCWSSAKIVITYVAGWASVLSTNAPADLQAAISEQVKYRAEMIDRDLGVRSEAVPDVYSASYALPGGDNVGASGLLIQVENALAPYRNIAI